MRSLRERLEIVRKSNNEHGFQHWKTGIGGREERMKECGVVEGKGKIYFKEKIVQLSL